MWNSSVTFSRQRHISTCKQRNQSHTGSIMEIIIITTRDWRMHAHIIMHVRPEVLEKLVSLYAHAHVCANFCSAMSTVPDHTGKWSNRGHRSLL